MNLYQYVMSKGGTGKITCPVLAKVAKKAGCSEKTLYMVALGHKTCGPKMAIKLETATQSEVLRADLRPDLWTRSIAA